jgi:hypothetical protein
VLREKNKPPERDFLEVFFSRVFFCTNASGRCVHPFAHDFPMKQRVQTNNPISRKKQKIHPAKKASMRLRHAGDFSARRDFFCNPAYDVARGINVARAILTARFGNIGMAEWRE